MKRAPENTGALIAEVKKLTVRRSAFRDNWAALVELPEVNANLDDLLGVLDRETLDRRAKWAR